MYSIEIKNVTKNYKVFKSPRQRLLYSVLHRQKFAPRIFTAVNDINLTIAKGEILGIIGRNGAGKSTLLKMITGVSFPTTGTITSSGRISSLLELGAGFNPELTGMENIYFQGNLLGIDRSIMEARVPAIIDFAAIGDFIEQPVKNYSSGMFARLAFATAIHVDPDILIVDEVLAVGDISFQFKCIEKMKEFAKKGVTIIFVTHSMMSLYRFCHRAVWIDQGAIVMDGTVEDVVPVYEDRLKMMDNMSSLSSDKMQQFGNSILEVTRTQIFHDGAAVGSLATQDPFTLAIDYELLQSLEEAPYFALSIVKDGLSYDMFGVFPSQKRYTLPASEGQYTLNIDFQTNGLNIGEYDIYFAILEKNGISQLFFNRILSLNIQGELDSLGLLDMKHTTEVILRDS